MRKAFDPKNSPMPSLWGAELRASESETRYLESVCEDSNVAIPLPMQMGEYDITRVLGRGGMGVVFEGEHRRMQRRVAIKVLGSQFGAAHAAQQQFLSEIRAVARLLHPRIVTAFDAGQFESVVYLVMEYVDGASMADIVSREGTQPLTRALDWMRQAAEGLAHAHLNSIIHRDVKPGNLMVTVDGAVKLLDLGLASFTVERTDTDALEVSGICGTPEYMAPEQFLRGDVTESVDIYALGCTFFYLLVGRVPYQGNTIALMRDHTTAPIPRFADAGIVIPPRLQRLLDRMLAKRVEDRIESMDQVINEIDVVLSSIKNLPLPVTKMLMASAANDSSLEFDVPPDFAQVTLNTIGVDLGNRYLAAALQTQQDSSERYDFAGNHQPLLPALVISSRTRTAVFGDEAQHRMRAAKASEISVLEILRAGDPISFGTSTVSPSLPLAMLLEYVYREVDGNAPDASDANKQTHLMLSVPSCFSQVIRERYYRATIPLSFNSTRLVDRNIAAVLSQFEVSDLTTRPTVKQQSGYWLVVSVSDLAMEVTLLAVSSRRIQTLAVASDSESGQSRWNRRISRWIRSKVSQQDSTSGSMDGSRDKLRLKYEIDVAIDQLATNESVALRFRVGNRNVKATLNADLIVSHCSDIIQHLGGLVATVLSDAGVDAEEIACCLAIGSLTTIAPIKNLLRNFGVEPTPRLLSQTDLALGLARLGQIARLSTHFQPRIIPCTPHDIGIAIGNLDQSETSLLIPRLTSLPARVTRQVEIRRDGSQELTICERLSSNDTLWVPFAKAQLKSPDRQSHQTVFEVGESGQVGFHVGNGQVSRSDLGFDLSRANEIAQIREVLLRLRFGKGH